MKARAERRVISGPGFIISMAAIVLVALNLRIAITSVPPLLGTLGIGTLAQSLLLTTPIVCLGLGALAGPRLRLLLGEESAIFVLMAFLAAGIALRAFLPGWMLFPGTLICALSLSLANVLLPSLVKRRFPHRLGSVTAAYTTALTVGAGLAAGVAVPVLNAAHGSGRIALGVWALPAAAALLVWIPQLRVGKVPQPLSPHPDKLRIWKSGLAWQVTLFLGLSSLVFYGTFSWLPQVYLARGISSATTGYLLLFMSVVGITGSLVAPPLAARMRDQRLALVIVTATQMAGFLGMFLAPTRTAFLWAAIFGIGNGGTFSLSLLLIVLRSADEHVAARLSSMAQTGGYLIAAAGPLTLGVLHSLTHSWIPPMLFLVAASLACLFAGLGAGRRRVVDRREAPALGV
jgi:MFS transporter, CP family, cyanate transporter